ncbi:hypothetical protein SJAV_05160 [Sulfurisphaera javensis]|uniref:Uncharacterized protein n=1 Tax=Sulfurisphaera javensis TaxID=2049879 RepID=A0AAT9GP29_9CREN
MDYIKVAESLGFDKSLVVNIYKKISGGYYISLYYAKYPILYSLDNWPKKYLSKKFIIWYNSHFDSAIDEIISLFITLDVKVIHSVSSILLSRRSESDKINQDIDFVFTEISSTASRLGFSNYPQRIDLKLNESLVTDFVKDILNRRENEIKSDIYTILGEMAYESDYLTKIKGEKDWIRVINRENILKALYLENKLIDFLEEEKIKLRYLIASKTLIFDKLLLEKGINETINDIRELKNEELKEEIEKLYSQINNDLNYF